MSYRKSKKLPGERGKKIMKEIELKKMRREGQAVIRVNQEIWDQFKKKARQEWGMSASEAIMIWMSTAVKSKGLMEVFEGIFQAAVKSVKGSNEK